MVGFFGSRRESSLHFGAQQFMVWKSLGVVWLYLLPKTFFWESPAVGKLIVLAKKIQNGSQFIFSSHTLLMGVGWANLLFVFFCLGVARSRQENKVSNKRPNVS
jgi:hypothetical protein